MSNCQSSSFESQTHSNVCRASRSLFFVQMPDCSIGHLSMAVSSWSRRSISGWTYDLQIFAGSTFAPVGEIHTSRGNVIQRPVDLPQLQSLAACSSMCNDSSLFYNPGGSFYRKQYLPQQQGNMSAIHSYHLLEST